MCNRNKLTKIKVDKKNTKQVLFSRAKGCKCRAWELDKAT